MEYAIEAIKLGSTALGIQTKEGVLLAVEKRITSSLMEPSSIEKIVEVDAHIGCAMSGLTADARTMIDKARVEAQNYWFTYNEPMPTESVTQSVCNLAMQFGETVRLCFLSFILSFFFERCASSFVQRTRGRGCIRLLACLRNQLLPSSCHFPNRPSCFFFFLQ